MIRASLLGWLLLLMSHTAIAQTPITIGVIIDGEQYQFAEVPVIFKSELVDLTQGEFDLTFKEYSANWSTAAFESVFNQAYADRDVDVVLVLGFSANQVGVSRESFPKPTFMPLVFDSTLTGAPSDGNVSGKRNLNYLAERVSLEQEIATFKRVAPFTKAAFLIDEVILEAIPDVPFFLKEIGNQVGVEFFPVTHDGQTNNLAEQIPADADAVLYTGLPRLTDRDFDALIENLIQRRLPSFSISSRTPVVRGMLAADTVETDWQRLARRNALNMQAVFLGERAQDQSVFFRGKQELTINLETARRIGISPRFDVLSEATLLNESPQPSGIELNLEKVARMALNANLDIKAEEFNAATGDQDVRIARSALYPSVSLSADNLSRRDTPLVQAGQLPERSLDTSVGLNQLLYSDDSYAGLSISRANRDALLAGLESVQLDVVQEATQAYIDVLRFENLLAIQQQNLDLTKSNLDLARDRVRVGASSNADVFRWQSDLASARSDVLAARASLDQAREILNRILNRPIQEPFQVVAASASDPFVMTTDRFDELVNSPRTLQWLADFLVQRGLASSPERQQLESFVEAKEREILNLRRDFWVPDISLGAQYSDNLSQSGVGSGGFNDGIADWTVSLSASLPVFAGGRRRAELARAELDLRRLETEVRDIDQRIEQSIRSALNIVSANYVNIDLSREAADAASQNLDLVTQSYARGTVNIIQLLDAQNQSISADLNAINAVYDFLDAALVMQRASARFDFLLSPQDQALAEKALEDYILEQQSRLPSR